MKIPDVNVLVHAQNSEIWQHKPCRSWLDEALSGTETVGLLWIVIVGFIRLSTSARIFASPMTSGEAVDTAQRWIAQPNVAIVAPGARHLAILNRFLERAGTAGNLTTDAHIAATASEHGATVVSCDTDFLRFPDLRVLDPTR